jgi:stage II sporulation protein AA (anti-sigma F factor antagonist)
MVSGAITLETRFLSSSLGPDVAVLYVEGELDLHAAPQLEEEIAPLVESRPPPNLVVDLSSVTLLDSAALRFLLSAARTLAEANRLLVLVTGDPSLRRRLQVSGFEHVFPVEQGLPEPTACVSAID